MISREKIWSFPIIGYRGHLTAKLGVGEGIMGKARTVIVWSIFVPFPRGISRFLPSLVFPMTWWGGISRVERRCGYGGGRTVSWHPHPPLRLLLLPLLVTHHTSRLICSPTQHNILTNLTQKQQIYFCPRLIRKNARSNSWPRKCLSIFTNLLKRDIAFSRLSFNITDLKTKVYEMGINRNNKFLYALILVPSSITIFPGKFSDSRWWWLPLNGSSKEFNMAKSSNCTAVKYPAAYIRKHTRQNAGK